MEIVVEIKDVYGMEKVYPVCDKAKHLARLTGNKTLTDFAIRVIKELGYTITVKQRTL